MSTKTKYDTIIIEFKSSSSYSYITTVINLKISLLPVFEHKIEYSKLKTNLLKIAPFAELCHFNICDSDFVYCEFYYGYRMVKEKYLDLDKIINGIKSFIRSYSDNHEMAIFKLNYTGVKENENAEDPKGFLDNIKNQGANVIDEKSRIYTNPKIGSEKAYRAEYFLIHDIVYNTVKTYEHAFDKEKNVYKNIIAKGLISDLSYDDNLINSIINDEEFSQMIANEKHIIKINGVYFIDINRI
jgi:hypothetical protein